MKKRLTAILLAMLMIAALIPAVAFAQTEYAELKKEMISVEIPDALNGIVTADIQDGSVVFTINQATAEKWAAVYNSSWDMNGFSRMIDAGFYIATEEDNKCFIWKSDHVLTAEEETAFLESSGDYSGKYDSVYIAHFLETEAGYEMIPQPEEWFCYIYWRDSEGNMVDSGIHRMKIEVRLASGVGNVLIGENLLPLLPKVPANRVELAQIDKVAASYDAVSGVAAYTFADAAALSSSSNITTNIKIPSIDEDDVAKCVITNRNNIWGSKLTVNVNEGVVSVPIETSTEATKTDKWKLTWVDEYDVPLYEEVINISTSLADGSGWMDIYWEPIESGRLTVSNAPAGLTATMKDGGVSCSFSAAELPSIDAFEKATVTITPPTINGKTPVAYRIGQYSAGNVGFNYNKAYADQCKGYMEQKEQQTDVAALVKALCPMNKLDVGDSGITLLYAPAFKATVLVDWLFEDGTSYGEYYNYENGEIVYRVVSEAVGKEDDITGEVDKPIMVKDGEWKLTCTEYPQDGPNNARYMELEAKAYDGDKVVKDQLDGETVIYIPFPYGIAKKDAENYTFTLTHYLDGEYKTYENLTATPTPHGLRFVVKSLSPFVLEWNLTSGNTNTGNNSGNHNHTNAPEIVIVPPKTGDASVIGYALMSIVAAAGVMGIRRK